MSSLVDEVLSMAERLGVGVEKLAEARLDCWTLTCHERIHLFAGDPSRVQPEDTLALPPPRLPVPVPND
jgi:hypothetical protein